jgi:hypothetical protein
MGHDDSATEWRERWAHLWAVPAAPLAVDAQEPATLHTVAAKVLRDMQAQDVLIEWQTLLDDALRAERAELEALRKDAERYRKIRAALGPGRHSMWTPQITVPFEPEKTYTPDGLDAALDALPAVGAA